MHRNDAPTLKCGLARDKMLKEIVGSIRKCDPPQVFGIYGDWGSGKTSFLCQLQYALCGQATLFDKEEIPEGLAVPSGNAVLPVVWFEAWRHQSDAFPIVALLQEIRAQFSPGTKFWEEAKKVNEVALHAALLTIDKVSEIVSGRTSLKGAGGIVESIQRTGDRYEKDHFMVPLQTSTITKLLDQAIGAFLGKGKAKKLVVVIDDLDRCEPEAAWRLLEGIKIYLNLKRCVFVLAMNEQIVTEAIAKVYKDGDGDRVAQKAVWRAREYMEKLCQTGWHLYSLRTPGKFLGDLLDTNDELGNWICALVDDKGLLPMNPRKMKAFANLLERYLSKAPERLVDAEREAKIILILAYLSYFHQPIYRVLYYHRERFYEQQLVPWASGADITLTGISEVLQGVLLRSEWEAAPDGPRKSRPRYYDPVLDNVLLIQELIAEVPKLSKGDFDRYLYI